MFGGMALLIGRSPDWRVKNFYLVLCSLPLDILAGLVMPIRRSLEKGIYLFLLFL